MSETGGKPLLAPAGLVLYKCSVSPWLRIKAELKICHFRFLKTYHRQQQQEQGRRKHRNEASKWTLESVRLCAVCAAALLNTRITHSITHLYRLSGVCGSMNNLFDWISYITAVRVGLHWIKCPRYFMLKLFIVLSCLGHWYNNKSTWNKAWIVILYSSSCFFIQWNLVNMVSVVYCTKHYFQFGQFKHPACCSLIHTERVLTSVM